MTTDPSITTEGDAPADLDGHTLEELSDYLDRGRTPRDSSIEGSAACRIALVDLQRLRDLSEGFLAEPLAAPSPAQDRWVAGVLSRINRTARAGRDLPLDDPDPAGALLLTEGALRSLVRSAGDAFPGFLVGRVRFLEPISTPTAEIALEVHVDVMSGVVIGPAVAALRTVIAAAIRAHTRLTVGTIDVVVRDVLTADDA